MDWFPSPSRYDAAPFRRCGLSGLDLPPISLGLWHNFGETDVFATARAVVRRAFDRGVTHFDLANNYGTPYGSAERNFGEILRRDFQSHRDELVITTKAGWDMWPGPYGQGGSRKYLLASLDQSLRRMGLDYVDIFYSHRPTPDVPLEETIGALVHAYRQGKALYVGISSYDVAGTLKAAEILQREGVPLLVHQPVYSLLNREIENGLLDALEKIGAGCVVFSPLAQGLLTDKYLSGVPDESRAAKSRYLDKSVITPTLLTVVRELNEIARTRGQSLAQMAIAWTLRDSRVTSSIAGARTVAQLDETLDALKNATFSPEELARIEQSLSALKG
ncbi:L-glyceraldehyde 3-phosphate reductase [Acetobacter suratthaniensis]|uniref:L-glyceraldehyde 3-phosphate reductase n=1 Tax=Acetobacter suratthaniensis TaxID=1502841 RepID=A0ABS3LNK2_9PROT|nr:L-glyceraldehyde 3-phosphate reductase [Acetobacter suratthaniensis]MBO1328960.1 L-glyceraldehyde 3-phosphate reductase [Acetobacter suratthaniensis]MCX2567122.1 L-glyceraldehyde 3-phosphate reductase [Acetobacter suratthaniensis]